MLAGIAIAHYVALEFTAANGLGVYTLYKQRKL
jgi:hypothetical protein